MERLKSDPLKSNLESSYDSNMSVDGVELMKKFSNGKMKKLLSQGQLRRKIEENP